MPRRNRFEADANRRPGRGFKGYGSSAHVDLDLFSDTSLHLTPWDTNKLLNAGPRLFQEGEDHYIDPSIVGASSLPGVELGTIL